MNRRCLELHISCLITSGYTKQHGKGINRCSYSSLGRSGSRETDGFVKNSTFLLVRLRASARLWDYGRARSYQAIFGPGYYRRGYRNTSDQLSRAICLGNKLTVTRFPPNRDAAITQGHTVTRQEFNRLVSWRDLRKTATVL